MYRYLLILIVFLLGSLSGVRISCYAAAGGRKSTTDLPEVTVESNRNKIVHILAYVRDYSTMSTYTDTVSLFREKVVDYMLVPNDRIKFKGWTIPRTLVSKSYYRFTNSEGLDSVSDESSFHFSWTDWVGMPPLEKLPDPLGVRECGTDTLHGKYSPYEIWNKEKDAVRIDVNLMADAKGRRWCPSVNGFFQDGVDFYDFKLQLRYENVLGSDISPLDITGYSFSVESNGRGREMKRIMGDKENYYFTTQGEVYVIDREYISVKDARKWETHNFDEDAVGLFEPSDAPPLDPVILKLISRVEKIDKEEVRIALPPDERLGSGKLRNDNFNIGKRALFLFKDLTGISRYKFRKNQKNKWREFKERVKRMKENRER
ncbi:MAG: hypothetical protein HDS95_06860 [Bacteroidales bacterium]|nr:hypothetical protein [Bacteroidales bacterium]MBD5189983.1 hypothetical protein [Bacteroidales bacterium]